MAAMDPQSNSSANEGGQSPAGGRASGITAAKLETARKDDAAIAAEQECHAADGTHAVLSGAAQHAHGAIGPAVVVGGARLAAGPGGDHDLEGFIGEDDVPAVRTRGVELL